MIGQDVFILSGHYIVGSLVGHLCGEDKDLALLLHEVRLAGRTCRGLGVGAGGGPAGGGRGLRGHRRRPLLWGMVRRFHRR